MTGTHRKLERTGINNLITTEAHVLCRLEWYPPSTASCTSLSQPENESERRGGGERQVRRVMPLVKSRMKERAIDSLQSHTPPEVGGEESETRVGTPWARPKRFSVLKCVLAELYRVSVGDAHVACFALMRA